ncbi:hypothetical protein A5758_07785 [Mycobacterium sp. 852014-50255_SCH5639931]|nr:hypothetical protein A5758_07785 [Mycobacterium sp. 852014-50255_SCH5639931]
MVLRRNQLLGDGRLSKLLRGGVAGFGIHQLPASHMCLGTKPLHHVRVVQFESRPRSSTIAGSPRRASS